VNLDAGEVLGISIMAKIGIILFQRHFWLKCLLPLQLYIYPFPTPLFF